MNKRSTDMKVQGNLTYNNATYPSYYDGVKYVQGLNGNWAH